LNESNFAFVTDDDYGLPNKKTVNVSRIHSLGNEPFKSLAESAKKTLQKEIMDVLKNSSFLNFSLENILEILDDVIVGREDQQFLAERLLNWLDYNKARASTAAKLMEKFCIHHVNRETKEKFALYLQEENEITVNKEEKRRGRKRKCGKKNVIPDLLEKPCFGPWCPENSITGLLCLSLVNHHPGFLPGLAIPSNLTFFPKSASSNEDAKSAERLQDIVEVLKKNNLMSIVNLTLPKSPVRPMPTVPFLMHERTKKYLLFTSA
jgi:hypothetical protein